MVQLAPVVTATPESVDAIAKLKTIAGKILESPALQDATQPINRWATLGELSDTVYAGLREVMGLGKLADAPVGTVSVRSAGTAVGTYVIEYLDKAGKVLKTSAEMLPYDAQQVIKGFQPGGAGVGDVGGEGDQQHAAGDHVVHLSQSAASALDEECSEARGWRIRWMGI